VAQRLVDSWQKRKIEMNKTIHKRKNGLKKVLIILVIIILIVLGIFIADVTQTAVRLKEGQADIFECFDYVDNDNDGDYDLFDKDCYGLGLGDIDGDGYSDIDEYESGTDLRNPNSIPQYE